MIPKILSNLRMPIISAPMFIISQKELIIAACKSGIVGSMPSLNARTTDKLEKDLSDIENALKEAENPAPYAINLITHKSNTRLKEDLLTLYKHKTPIVITSLSPPGEVVKIVHDWGGIVLHDVISSRFAEKALESNVDGLIAVCSGAGGHTGPISAFAFIAELRKMYDGFIVAAGGIHNGSDILAAQVLGANMSYMGTSMIATNECSATQEYKECILRAQIKDIITTSYFTGATGNFLKESIISNSIDPAELKTLEQQTKQFNVKAWRDVWSAGQGSTKISKIISVAELVDKIEIEYKSAIDNIANIKAIHCRI